MAVLDYDMAKASWELKNVISDDLKRATEEENSLHSHWRAANEEILEAKKLLITEGPGSGWKSAIAIILCLGGLALGVYKPALARQGLNYLQGVPRPVAIRIFVYGSILAVVLLLLKSYGAEMSRMKAGVFDRSAQRPGDSPLKTCPPYTRSLPFAGRRLGYKSLGLVDGAQPVLGRLRDINGSNDDRTGHRTRP